MMIKGEPSSCCCRYQCVLVAGDIEPKRIVQSGFLQMSKHLQG